MDSTDAPPTVHPLMLYSVDPDFKSGLANTSFCWRWLTRINADQGCYRVLTIEDDNSSSFSSEIPPNLLPVNIVTANHDFYKGIENFYFNWRWFTVDNGS